jgi:hypothetical protein
LVLLWRYYESAVCSLSSREPTFVFPLESFEE